jgi:two-component system CheB/CheR fusion protein
LAQDRFIQKEVSMVGEHQHAPSFHSHGCSEKIRVLVVDDHPDIVNTYARLLRESGFEVATALNGLDALKLVDEFRPRVTLLDIGLPDLDGYEVARRLRADASLSMMPLIAITAYGAEENRQMAKAVGFDEFLVKPVLFYDLLSVIRCRLQSDPH